MVVTEVSQQAVRMESFGGKRALEGEMARLQNE
jgi:hypothetical protein